MSVSPEQKHADPVADSPLAVVVPDSSADDVVAVFGVTNLSGSSTPTGAGSPGDLPKPKRKGNEVVIEELLTAKRPMPRPHAFSVMRRAEKSAEELVDHDVEALAEPASPQASPPTMQTWSSKSPKRSTSASPAGLSVKDVCAPIQIRSEAISDTLIPSSEEGTKKKILPKELPDVLLMPLSQRCDFCIKFDSVCSQCHFKWKGSLKARQENMMAHFKLIPEVRKVAVFMATIARGTVEYLQAMIIAKPDSHTWFANFEPLPIDEGKYHPRLLECGRVFPLHVAMAFKRLDMAKALMESGAYIRRSETRIKPTTFLVQDEDSSSLPDEWEEMLEQQQHYVEYTMAERAKSLRNDGHYDDATLEYEALLKLNPHNEFAMCGIAKMHFDQGKYKDCVTECLKVLKKRDEVHWVEFSPETMESLRVKAIAEFHAKAHAVDGPAWVKECGCIDTARTVISLRRIPYKIIRENILPFLPGANLYRLWSATRIPLFRNTVEEVTATACDSTIGAMLAAEFGYPEMYESIRTDLPVTEGASSIIQSPMQFLGLEVVAMGDFHTFILRATVVGGNPKWRKRFFESDELPKRVVVAKQFRVHRAGIGKAWDVHEAGEWEVDDQATGNLQASTKKK